MPRNTPINKVEMTRALGAQIVLEGTDLEASKLVADRIAEQDGLIPIHPYDDAQVIAGQGTVALEMLADVPDLDWPRDPDWRWWFNCRDGNCCESHQAWHQNNRR